jgi:ribulose 1,5-bisphosphate synthetase/thiazole synthase
MKELKVIPVETDVLIVGGGLAGCMAAINAASEKRLRVTLAEKSDTRALGVQRTTQSSKCGIVSSEAGCLFPDTQPCYRCRTSFPWLTCSEQQPMWLYRFLGIGH